ncbi:MAG: response regulator transcription factor [Salegentibacter sp.]
MSRTIIIVDDHNLFAQSLQGLINSFQDYQVSKVCRDGREFVDYIEANHTKPDIVLLDVRMPVMDGIETMSWLSKNHPEQKVIALTMEHDEETIIKMVEYGCRGYLLKDIEPDEFLVALEDVMESGYYCREEMEESLQDTYIQKISRDLTRREMEFLSLACTEKTYKEIADEMNLSPKTIDGYRESLFQKLQVRSRIGMVIFAIKHKLCEI